MKFILWRIPVLLLVISLLITFMTWNIFSCSGTLVVELELVDLSSIVFPVTMILDSVRVRFALVVSLVSFCVFLFAVYYIDGDPFFNRFTWLLLLFVTSIIVLIFSGSLFVLLLGWDGLGLSSFALIIYYSSRESLRAGYLTLLVNRLGDCVIIITMFLFLAAGHFSLFNVRENLYWVVFLIGLSSLTKRAQYPFSSWLPAAIAAPTPVRALVHSSTLVTAGVYLLIRLRLSWEVPCIFSTPLILLRRVTCILGGLAAIFENDLKKIIALSTLRQLGVIIYRIRMNLVDLALFHLYVHAMFKALLFIGAGTVLMIGFGIQDIRLLGGILKNSPLTSVFFVISSLCLAGVPFTRGFCRKHLILEKILCSHSCTGLRLIFMVVGRVATAIYSVRLMKIVFGSQVITTTCSPMVNKSFLFFCPILILGGMGVRGGLLFPSINIAFVDSAFIPGSLSIAFNIILFVGTVIGIYFIFGNGGSTFLTTMFYLTPSSYSIRKVIPNIRVITISLDSGWLEPRVVINRLLPQLSVYAHYFLLWPRLTKSTIVKVYVVFFLILYYSL